MEDLKHKFMQALNCLALELPEKVFDDFYAKTKAYLESVDQHKLQWLREIAPEEKKKLSGDNAEVDWHNSRVESANEYRQQLFANAEKSIEKNLLGRNGLNE